MRRFVLAVLILTAAPAFAADLTLDQIMAAPDWIGPAVERPYWSVDGESIYYSLKRDGSEIRDLYRVNPENGRSTRVTDKQLANADGNPVFDPSHTHAAFLRHGDVFVRQLGDGSLRQVTRTKAMERGIQWSADGSALQYRHGNQWYRYQLDAGSREPVANLNAADDPNAQQPGSLTRLQRSLFESLRDAKTQSDTQREHERMLDAADPTRAAPPFWLGQDVRIVDTELSPNGRWMLVVTESAAYKDGKPSTVNHYVTDSGYTEEEKARPYVGRDRPAAQALVLLDLNAHKQYELSVDALPGIHEDPLAKLRAQTQAALRKQGHEQEADALDAPKTRGVSIAGPGFASIAWSDDGNAAAIQFRANDNKDRWLATVDFNSHKLVSQHRLHDDAWVGENFNRFGFLKNSDTLWYLSEESGYSQLYVKSPRGKSRQLTSGKFEVSVPVLSPDGKWFYVLANKQAPGAYDVYRVATSGGTLERVTRYEGLYSFEGGPAFVLSPDGHRLAVLHSSAYLPAQLAVVDVASGQGKELTDTRKPGYKAMQWIEPEIVKVPSTHGAGEINAKLYKAADYDMSKPHPAVFFVHGAGYLQDVTRGWTYYFREQMFNNLLAQEGYIVIDMDYRASAGYGRDWRTAIYRQMGHPELEDLLDGKAWLVEHYHVDPNRVGIYGGSYGGFMTEMALLRAPGEFAAGAALRPVSDWVTYNDGYTSAILNDPQLDPEAYAKSSPIEFAAGLADPLLICHGLIDNNVLPSDSIRLYQRFIELHKKNFWLSLYPMERHGFERADSWYDEYRRVHELFTRFLTLDSQGKVQR